MVGGRCRACRRMAEVVEIALVADTERLSQLKIEILP